MTIGYLALGSNLGNRIDYLRKAVTYLNQTAGITVLEKSAIYETKPYGDVPQDNYLNAVVKIETNLEPLKLLDQTQLIEKKLGRERLIHWGPRTIDIDILLLEDLTFSDQRLTIPHSEIKKRSFVLVPLKDVYSQSLLFGQAIEDLIDQTGNQEEVWNSTESW
ncbi:2-amino-4-hydroxy-6-hydroxymethyldihydropteridine diphosphokinase [Enterococcus pseudoavium]|uniref:2-amino-4-hydroxy-6- hydroxymethyldihydropteridine diphosphokinase n=1 Tax=Enterococcus pseudoavium TaxID=44007 RepID=UPI000833EE95|nr:2-amino-4-hydroxy-6-hydroxymethyldihydropteridine diphosphokinase [Enterococcus pseudoavium]